MAASTITRDTWTNDTGTPSAPNADGTILNNNVLQNHIYARIDAMFAGAGAYVTFTLGGLFKAEGFGLHEFTAGSAGSNAVQVKNTTAGTGNAAYFQASGDSGNALQVIQTSSTFTTAGDSPQDGGVLRESGAGGLNISTTHASGMVRVYTGSGTIQRFQINGAAAGQMPQALGAGAAVGPYLHTGRNTSGNGAAGNIQFYQRDGTLNYVWVDNSANPGMLRIHTAQPTEDNSTVADTAGSVVGTQASLRAVKDILKQFTRDDDEASLVLVRDTPIFRFRYKSGWNSQEFVGITTDDSPEFGYDRSETHPQGKAFNPVSAFGHTVSAIKALLRRVEALEAR